jgi:effector-binding domain-containing protein
MKKIFLPFLVLFSTLFSGTHVHAIEEPSFTVARHYNDFELREYAPYLVAEVTVPGPAADAGGQGFRLLAAYIFGKNNGERKIDMTAPVTQMPKQQKIDMTAPVTQTAAEDGFVIQFKMPAAFTLDTLPEPLDPRVRLAQVPGARYAVIRYSGFWTEDNYEKHLSKLKTLMASNQLEPLGPPVYARYDAPYVPWFMRRNEIWIATR